MKPTIDDLLTRYYAGETTLDEERQLRDFFERTQPLPDHLRPHAALFGYVTQAQTEQPSTDLVAQLDRKLGPQRPVPVRQLTSWSLRLAAGVTLLLLGFAGGRYYTRRQPAADTELAEAGQSRADSPEADSIKSALAFDAMTQTSASDRIQAVYQSSELDQADREITQLLINTLNFDANVNVRLAACQALLRFEGEEGVREALIQSLRIQKDPNVQLTLIETLVAIKEKRAAREMQWLARNGQVLEIVRLKAEEGVGALSKVAKSTS